MAVSHLPTSTRFWSRAQSLACASSIGGLMGVMFWSIGSLLGWIGWMAHDPLDLFATGFACGFVSAIVGAVVDCDSEDAA